MQDDLNTTIAEARQEIQERYKAEIEALKSTNEALKAKTSNLKSKQGGSITQDEFNDLKAIKHIQSHKESRDFEK